MSLGVAESTMIVSDLGTLPAAERLARLRETATSEAELLALGDYVEQLATVEVGSAVAVAESVVALADEIGLPWARARARRARAQTLAYAGQFAEALASCAEAIAIAEIHGKPVEAARGRLARVHPLASLGRHEEAVEAGQTARDAFLAAGEPALAARADLNLGAVFDSRDESARALDYYDRARPFLTGEPLTLAQLDANRGVALMNLDQFVVAESAFRSAVASFHTAGYNWAAAIAEGNLAFLATRQGRLEVALHHFEQARRSLEADDSPVELARLLAEQADALALLGLPSDAVATYEQVLPQLDQYGLAAEAATAHAGHGRALLQLGRFVEADVALTTAGFAFDNLGMTVSRARVDLDRADLAFSVGRFDDARFLLADALDTFHDRPADLLAARYQRARLALAEGELDLATAELEVAGPTAEKLEVAPLLADLLYLRGRLMRARGNPDQALADLRRARQLVERVRGQLQAERFRAAFLGNRAEIHEALTALLLDNGSDEACAEAFATTEQAKSRALLDLVGGALDLSIVAEKAATRNPGEALLLAELARVRAELNWLYGRCAETGGDSTREAVAGWRQTIKAREHELDALRDRLSVGRGVSGLFAEPLALEAVLALVPAGAALVEYFVTDGMLHAFALHDGRLHPHRELVSLARVTEQVRRVHFQVGRAISASQIGATDHRAERLLTDARRELAALYDLVLRPLNHLLHDVSRLIIVPHGPLHAAPFHAMWDGERYLVERYETQTVPSASLLGRLGDESAPSPGRDRRALVVGVPDALAPRIGQEAEHLARALNARLLLGPEATLANVTAATRDADVVHFASHGRFSVEHPLSSGLKLADGWLTVRDIYGLSLRADLVTLSACDTGRAIVGNGDELIGLIRGFFAAGASSLLLSLWLVNDESTALQMSKFYDGWRKGASKPAALRAAQLATLANRPHPAFWAPFVLGGNS